MIPLHLFIFKMICTDGANTVLSLIRFSLVVLGERANIQMPFVAI